MREGFHRSLSAETHRYIRLGLLALLLALPLATRAATVAVPLTVETRFVQRAVAEVLELDPAGRGEIRADDCNRVELDDLAVATLDGEIVVSLAVRAESGAHAFGQCRGPLPWQGRMSLELVPGVEPGGVVVRFTPQGAELLHSDGAPGLLSGPARLLAENLILPRLGAVRLDLSRSLEEVDRLLASALPDWSPEQAERTRIHAVDVVATGLSLRLKFGIGAAPEFAVLPAEPRLSAGERVQMEPLEDELDGFLTAVITALAESAPTAELRLELLAVLLDARHAIAEAFSEDGQAAARADPPEPDPVRRIFIESWDRLRPWLAELDLADVPDLEGDLRLAAFMAGGDALRALDALGAELGLEISADGLRRLARLLLAEKVPERFTPLPQDVDPALRALFGLDPPPPREPRGLLLPMLDFFMPAASAETGSPAEALRGLVPRLANLDDYLQLVANLLQLQTSEHLSAGSRIPARLESSFDSLVRATAWKESCWRQFIGSTENPRVLTSPAGALGMMQVSSRVWRGTYDPKRLAEEVDYNVTAGMEILEHYLVDYAIRRGEHKHPGGDDNLIRATYAAYNGGPSHMGRYRRENTPARLRAIDDDFWRHYQATKSSQWPEVSTCYATGD